MLNWELLWNHLDCTTEEKWIAFDTIKKMVCLVELARAEGLLALEGTAGSEQDFFLKHCLLFMIDGGNPEELEAYASAWMLADHAKGGRLLQMVVITEGLTLLMREQIPQMVLRRLGAWLGSDFAAAVDAEWNAMELRQRKEARRRHMESSASAIPEFDQLVHCHPDTLRQLVSRIDDTTLAVALRGASGESYQAVLQELPLSQRKKLEQDIDSLAHIRVCDAEHAQRQILSMMDADPT